MVSDPDFVSRLVVQAKRGKVKLTFSIVYLENYKFLQTTPNIDILYTVGKNFFSKSMDSRSLPQNKAPFGLNQLSKFCYFARKSLPTIWTLSSQTKGIVGMRRPRETCWSQEVPSKLVGER